MALLDDPDQLTDSGADDGSADGTNGLLTSIVQTEVIL